MKKRGRRSSVTLVGEKSSRPFKFARQLWNHSRHRQSRRRSKRFSPAHEKEIKENKAIDKRNPGTNPQFLAVAPACSAYPRAPGCRETY